MITLIDTDNNTYNDIKIVGLIRKGKRKGNLIIKWGKVRAEVNTKNSTIDIYDNK